MAAGDFTMQADQVTIVGSSLTYALWSGGSDLSITATNKFRSEFWAVDSWTNVAISVTDCNSNAYY
jgi:hypothetical protein